MEIEIEFKVKPDKYEVMDTSLEFIHKDLSAIGIVNDILEEKEKSTGVTTLVIIFDLENDAINNWHNVLSEVKETLEDLGGYDIKTTPNIEKAEKYFADIAKQYEDVDDIQDALRSLVTNGILTDEDYNYLTDNWDKILCRLGL